MTLCCGNPAMSLHYARIGRTGKEIRRSWKAKPRRTARSVPGKLRKELCQVAMLGADGMPILLWCDARRPFGSTIGFRSSDCFGLRVSTSDVRFPKESVSKSIQKESHSV